MAAIRDVITRFRLETNEADFRGFNQKLGAIKSGLSTVASAFGVTLGVAGGVALARMGYSAERARFNLERLAGADGIGRVRDAMRGVRADLEGLRRGSSGIFTQKSFDEAAANFVKVFGTGQRELEAFREIFKFATIESAATGKNVADIAKTIQDAISGGGFEALMDIPGFDIYRKQLAEFWQKTLDPGEPGGRVAIERRMQFVTNLLKNSAAEQKRTLGILPGNLLTADQAAAKLEETLESVGKLLAQIVKDLLPKVIAALERITEFIDDIMGKASKTKSNPLSWLFGKAVTSAGGAVGIPTTEKMTEEWATGVDRAWDQLTSREGLLGKELLKKPGQSRMQTIGDRLRYLGWLPPYRTGTMPGTPVGEQPAGGQSVVIYNEFNVRSTDPVETGREIMKQMNRQLNDARTSMPPTDRR